jgi:hypothetical protein
MNTAELMQAVEDAGCEFDCHVNGDLYAYLREIDEVWVMLPASFAWLRRVDMLNSTNNSRLFASFYHSHGLTCDNWHISSIYSKVDVTYDYPTGDEGHERVPVAIELNEGEDPYSERQQLTHPGAITMFLRNMVDEARRITKEIRAAQVKRAAKEYEL